jgi:hypothetical protein
MESVEQVFIAFGGPTALARAIGIKTSAASEMRRRGSIPVEYWQRLTAAADERGITDLSYERLVSMHTPAKTERVA